jgi:hypothetical protein
MPLCTMRQDKQGVPLLMTGPPVCFLAEGWITEWRTPGINFNSSAPVLESIATANPNVGDLSGKKGMLGPVLIARNPASSASEEKGKLIPLSAYPAPLCCHGGT